ncbi:hypothetical protein NDU88_006654 [Pleurodeles waltl]|uniref:Uncharacterized protein n=1 Tax=Pleurodeles waltl TaxID=8319 RepID=A0AAV7LAV3_PLEWA|nr:hypothetical protein NDU88_006654 [Pleurodeles waltl]
MEPSGLSAIRRGYPQRPLYGQTVVQNGALRAVSPQPRAPTVTCYGQTLVHLYRMEPSGLSGEGHRDPGMDRHLYRMQLSAVRRGHPQRPITDRHLYRMEPTGLSAVRRGHPQRPRYGQTLVNYGALQAVSRQARAPTETAVRTDTCTEWSPPGCEPSDEGTHRDPSTDRHLYRMEPSGLSAVRRGHPQRTPVRAVRRGHPQRPWYGQTIVQNGPLRAVRRGPQRPRYGQTLVQNAAVSRQVRAPTETHYGQTLVQNGAVRAVSRQARTPTETPVRTNTCKLWSLPGCQARAPTETAVRTDTCTEWSPPGSEPSDEGTHRGPRYGLSGEGTHRGPGTDRHLYRMDPSGLSGEGYRDPGMDRHLYRMEPSGLSALRRGHIQRPQYGQTLVQNGALWAVSRQARAHTETPVRTDTCTEWSPQGCQPSDEGTHRGPRYGLSGEGTHRGPGTDRHLYRMDPSGLSGEGYRDPGMDRHLYRMEPSGLSAVRQGYPQSPRYGQTLGQNGALWAVAVRRGHPQRPWYGLTLVQNGAVRAVGRQARAPTETPVRTDTCTEWSCQPSGEGTHRDPLRTDTCTEWSRPGCQPSGEDTHRDPGTDRHL